MKSKILSVLALTLMAAHCSKQSEKTVIVTNEVKVPVEATHVEALVAADAGASLSIGNKIQLTVPAGALSSDTNISVTKAGVAAPSENLVPLTNSVELGAHGVEFNKPVSLNVCYDPATLAAQSLKEETVAVYYVDPATGEYASVGGAVNKASHCVSADLQHFSTYLVAAQILQGGNNAPVISAPALLPMTPMAGLPLRLTTVITDFEQSTVNGQVGFGQIATAKLFYRIYQGDVNSAPYTEVPLIPDYNDSTNTRFTAKIPANMVTTAGLDYYIRAVDNLGLPKLRSPVKVTNQPSIAVNVTATGLVFQTNVVTDLAAGFRRSYTVKGTDNLGGSSNVEVESFVVNNGIGTAAQLSPAVVQFTATTAGAQNYRIGSLRVNSGAFSLTSQDIRVHAGILDHIALLSPTGVVLGNSITVNINSTYDFDVLGYDAYGNTTNVLPQFVIVPVSGAGTITPTGLYTAPGTAQTATLVATLDGVLDSILINVINPGISSWTVTNVGSATAQLLDIAWSGTRYVAPDSDCNLWTSTDLSSWTSQTSQFCFNGVTYGNGVFIGVGRPKYITTTLTAFAYSTDGINWTESPFPSGNGIMNDVVWSGSKFVAVGDQTVAVSNDGMNWTRVLGIISSDQLEGVTWSGTEFVTGGRYGDGEVLRSPDGVNWTRQYLPNYIFFWKFAASPTELVTVAYAFPYSNNFLVRSPDYVNWTDVLTTGSSSGYRDVRWTGIEFIAVGANGSIVTSPNGNTWQNIPSNTSQWLNAVMSWPGSPTIAVGNGGTVLRAN